MKKIIVATFFLAVLFSGTANAFLKNQSASLKGLQSFAVIVDEFGSDAGGAGFTMNTLKKDLELRLITSGIKVHKNLGDSEGVLAVVRVNANSVVVGKGLAGWAVRVEVYVIQPAYLGSNWELMPVTTWSRTTYKFVPASDSLADAIRAQAGTLASALSLDYMTVNSK